MAVESKTTYIRLRLPVSVRYAFPKAAAQPALERLHAAVVAHGAVSGFYITSRKFTQQASDYAATAPMKLVDGAQLEKSMRASLAGIKLPITYDAMCCQCGSNVQHRLDKAEALPCDNGHAVAPTIAQAALTPKEYPAQVQTKRVKRRRYYAPRYRSG